MDISYITSCKTDHTVEKEINRQSLGFISCEYNDMNLENIIVLKDNVYKISDFLTG